jgi:glutamine amidotransferase
VIAVVDYGMGNRRSVEKALQHVGVTAVITGDHEVLRSANGVVLPGVGAFPQATKNLSAAGLDTLLCELAAAGMPLLGICLGMQLLFERSSELGGAEGLGLIPGTVRPLDAAGLRVPHIGWSEVRFEHSSPLTAELPATGVPFYHVHSFVAAPSERSDVIGTAEYGERFATIVARGNVFGAQFHPEKSSRDGLSLLSSFVALTRDVGALAA